MGYKIPCERYYETRDNDASKITRQHDGHSGARDIRDRQSRCTGTMRGDAVKVDREARL